ncbi:MAG: hypothetical protein R2780_15560 [Crocinitomicaceae bacterium]|nr:hypothetical protein [Crocinitomicaceae bacterium]
MKNYFIALGILLFLYSCGSGEAETGTENESTTESVETDTMEVGDNENSIEFLEDYGNFKTKSAVYEQFGAENLDDDTSWYAEGTVMLMSTVLNDPNTGYRIKYVFKEDDPEKVDFIEAYNIKWSSDFENQGTQKVQTTEGLYTGMPLTELVEWNEGKNFEFSGFGWDYAGGVFETKDSKLGNSAVVVTLTMEDSGYDKYLNLLGDMSFKSDAEEVKGAPIVIGTLTYRVN